MASTEKKTTNTKKNTEATSDQKPKRKRGRPSGYSKALGNRICSELAQGTSLRAITSRDTMPSMSMVFRWLDPETGNASFREQYTRAKLESADALADDIKDIGDKTLTGFYDPASARVAIDSYKWLASKLKPKKYGDKIDMTSDGEKIGVSISAEQADQLIRARAKRSDT